MSCDSKEHCGHYKDRPKAQDYEVNDLIKPDENEPDEYLYFHSNGEVRVRHGVGDMGERKAKETVRVFGLNNPGLKAERRAALKQYLRPQLGLLDELMSWVEEDRMEYVDQEIEATRLQPYWTIIRHFFSRVES